MYTCFLLELRIHFDKVVFLRVGVVKLGSLEMLKHCVAQENSLPVKPESQGSTLRWNQRLLSVTSVGRPRFAQRYMNLPCNF